MERFYETLFLCGFILSSVISASHLEKQFCAIFCAIFSCKYHIDFFSKILEETDWDSLSSFIAFDVDLLSYSRKKEKHVVFFFLIFAAHFNLLSSLNHSFST